MNNQEKQILDLYFKYKSMTKVSNILGICRKRSVKPVLEKYNIPIINHQNKPKFDVHFFDNIDTEDKAYWLGFLYADGNVSSSDNTVSVGLQINDFSHLEKLKAAIQSNLQVKRDFSRGRCRFRFANSHTKKALIAHGLIPRKSYTLKFPEKIPFILIRHFIRGYFDGDGCVGVYDRADKPTIVRTSCIGTSNMLEHILDHAMIKSNLAKANKNGDDAILQFQLSGYKSYQFLTYLYQDSNVFLDRKFQKFQIAVQSLKRLYDYCGIKQEGCDITDYYKQCKMCENILTISGFYEHHAICKRCYLSKSR